MLSDRVLSTSSISRCQACRSELVSDPETGEQICTMCGIVSKSEGVHVALSYASPAAELGSTIGETPSAMLYDMSLPGRIVERDIDVRGKHVSDVGDLNRLRRLNDLTIAGDSRRRNLGKAAREIQRVVAALGAGNSIADRAYEIYRKGLGERGARGRSIIGMAGAAVYLACKELDVPRSAEEIEDLAEMADRNNIRHYSKLLMRETKMSVSPPDPSSQVSRIANKAGLSGVTERRALQILERVKNNGVLAGKRPVSVAAAALYLACSQTKEYTTQIRIAFAAGITTITLRKRSLEISKLLETEGFGWGLTPLSANKAA